MISSTGTLHWAATPSPTPQLPFDLQAQIVHDHRQVTRPPAPDYRSTPDYAAFRTLVQAPDLNAATYGSRATQELSNVAAEWERDAPEHDRARFAMERGHLQHRPRQGRRAPTLRSASELLDDAYVKNGELRGRTKQTIVHTDFIEGRGYGERSLEDVASLAEHITRFHKLPPHEGASYRLSWARGELVSGHPGKLDAVSKAFSVPRRDLSVAAARYQVDERARIKGYGGVGANSIDFGPNSTTLESILQRNEVHPSDRPKLERYAHQKMREGQARH